MNSRSCIDLVRSIDMERLQKQITLKHLVVSDQKMIGLKFYPDKVIQALLKEIPGLHWSEEFNMAFVLNKKQNLDLIFSLFRGVAWINCTRFYTNKPIHEGSEAPDVNWYRKRALTPGYRTIPEGIRSTVLLV